MEGLSRGCVWSHQASLIWPLEPFWDESVAACQEELPGRCPRCKRAWVEVPVSMWWPGPLLGRSVWIVQLKACLGPKLVSCPCLMIRYLPALFLLRYFHYFLILLLKCCSSLAKYQSSIFNQDPDSFLVSFFLKPWNVWNGVGFFNVKIKINDFQCKLSECINY